MGISGLLPLLRSITRRISLEQLAGETVAVDAYCWLHRGVYGSCAVDHFHGQVNERARETDREKAKACYSAGENKRAYQHTQKSAEVTPLMARRLIDQLRLRQIEYIVAPYEADAQLAWLNRSGRVAAVITEDSDLLLFGCKRVLFKLDRQGMADEVCLDRLSQITELDLSRFSHRRFRQMCMLSGCDYLASISGLGLKTAYKLLSRIHGRAEWMSTEDDDYFLKRVFALIREEFGQIPEGYERLFRQAELTFEHQRVYDHVQRQIVFLNPLPVSLDILSLQKEFGDQLEFLGPSLDDRTAERIAKGDICPISFEPFPEIEIVADKSSQESLELPFPLSLDLNKQSCVSVKRVTLPKKRHGDENIRPLVEPMASLSKYLVHGSRSNVLLKRKVARVPDDKQTSLKRFFQPKST